jgi:hypothetical protein
MSAFVNAIDVAYYPRLRTGKGKGGADRLTLRGTQYVFLDNTRPLQIVSSLLLTVRKLSDMHAGVYWTLVLCVGMYDPIGHFV